MQRQSVTTDVLPGSAVAGFDALTPEDFAALLAHAPELVLFSSGDRLRFPHPRLLAALTNQGIGVEVLAHQLDTLRSGRAVHALSPALVASISALAVVLLVAAFRIAGTGTELAEAEVELARAAPP